MKTRQVVRSLLVVMLVLLPATPAAANSLASWAWIWPGVVSIDPLFGLLPTVLVSLVERPFVSRAGAQRRPLLRSIRANLLSLLAGIPIAMFVWSLRSDEGLVGLAVVAVAVTLVVEIGYFRASLKESERLRWRWIVLGNLVSNALLAALALTVRTCQAHYPELGHTLYPYQPIFLLLHLAISLTMVTAALAEPAIGLGRLVFAPPSPGDFREAHAQPRCCRRRQAGRAELEEREAAADEGLPWTGGVDDTE